MLANLEMQTSQTGMSLAITEITFIVVLKSDNITSYDFFLRVPIMIGVVSLYSLLEGLLLALAVRGTITPCACHWVHGSVHRAGLGYMLMRRGFALTFSGSAL